MSKNKYPCISCRKNDSTCDYRKCKPWKAWFRDEWVGIRDSLYEAMQARKKQKRG